MVYMLGNCLYQQVYALVGALHKTTHLYTVVKGKCRVSSQYGNLEIIAPFMGETIPGTKRVIYAETDCVWITYHPTEAN